MKIRQLIFILGLALTSGNCFANTGFSVQVFGESGNENTSIGGANLMFTGIDRHDHSLTYFGLGFKTVEGFRPDLDGSYGQLVIGAALPWKLSPYVEVGLDPVDMFGEFFTDKEEYGFNGYIGMGARFVLNHSLSVDFGYKYHHFTTDEYVNYHDHHRHYEHEGTGFGTASVGLNLSF